MLLKFGFSNFRCFRSDQELSLMATRLKGGTGGTIELPGTRERALTCSGLYGANASGKTTVFRALQFMVKAVKDSHRLWEPNGGVPLETFKGSRAEETSRFVLDFLLAGVRYQYGFSATRIQVDEEWLFSYPNGRKQTLLHRQGPSAVVFGRNLPGENKTIAGLMRPNSLFLSAAAQNNHEFLRPLYDWFTKSFHFVIGDRQTILGRTAKMCAAEPDRLAIAQLLSIADLGIVDVQHRSRPSFPINMFDGRPRGTDHLIQLIHQLAGSQVALEFEDESNGTLAFVGLIGPIVETLRMGGMLILDELDASLHPLIAAHIIGMFHSDETNPKSAQLIFNTHDTNLLAKGILRRDQIWFTEKDRMGESHLYPLTDFKPREEENLRSGYLQGRYGAIPFVNSEEILSGSH